MQELKDITVYGKRYLFVNTSRNTQHGFAHDSVCYTPDYSKWEETRYYYNRTWERYRFESCMTGIARAMFNEARDMVKRAWMDARGYKRMTAGRKSEWQAFIGDAINWSPRMRETRTLVFAIAEAPYYDYNLGRRERDIIDNVDDFSLVMYTDDRRVFRIHSGDLFFDYDTVDRRVVG